MSEGLTGIAAAAMALSSPIFGHARANNPVLAIGRAAKMGLSRVHFRLRPFALSLHSFIHALLSLLSSSKHHPKYKKNEPGAGFVDAIASARRSAVVAEVAPVVVPEERKRGSGRGRGRGKERKRESEKIAVSSKKKERIVTTKGNSRGQSERDRKPYTAARSMLFM